MIKEHDRVVLRKPIPEQGLKMGDVVAATKLQAYLWEKNGKHGLMFSARALTVKSGHQAGSATAVA